MFSESRQSNEVTLQSVCLQFLCLLKGALCSFTEGIQTHNFNIYNINEASCSQRKIIFLFKKYKESQSSVDHV